MTRWSAVGHAVLARGAGSPAPAVYAVGLDDFAARRDVLGAEVFGPATLLVQYDTAEAVLAALPGLEGSLTATIHAEAGEDIADLVAVLGARSGRLLFDGWPTGVAVTWAQHHGGPWPATNSQHTSVGGDRRPPVPAADRVSGCAPHSASCGAAGRESARDPAPRGRGPAASRGLTRGS